MMGDRRGPASSSAHPVAHIPETARRARAERRCFAADDCASASKGGGAGAPASGGTSASRALPAALTSGSAPAGPGTRP